MSISRARLCDTSSVLTLRMSDSGQVVCTCLSATKQYNLVVAKGQWCFVAGKA